MMHQLVVGVTCVSRKACKVTISLPDKILTYEENKIILITHNKYLRALYQTVHLTITITDRLTH
jgi:hypothetical protein